MKNGYFYFNLILRKLCLQLYSYDLEYVPKQADYKSTDWNTKEVI
jgi:hypothetical protein